MFFWQRYLVLQRQILNVTAIFWSPLIIKGLSCSISLLLVGPLSKIRFYSSPKSFYYRTSIWKVLLFSFSVKVYKNCYLLIILYFKEFMFSDEIFFYLSVGWWFQYIRSCLQCSSFNSILLTCGNWNIG